MFQSSVYFIFHFSNFIIPCSNLQYTYVRSSVHYFPIFNVPFSNFQWIVYFLFSITCSNLQYIFILSSVYFYPIFSIPFSNLQHGRRKWNETSLKILKRFLLFQSHSKSMQSWCLLRMPNIEGGSRPDDGRRGHGPKTNFCFLLMNSISAIDYRWGRQKQVGE